MTATAHATETTEPPRDRWGRYLIPDPDTGVIGPYTRATTFAKSVSDTFGLTKWMLRMGGLGLAQRQDLLLGIAAADAGDNKTLDRIMAEAKDHAGAMAGANIGTALHTFTEQVDRGESPVIPPPFDADVAAYVEAVSAAGLEILPGAIEQVVVVPRLQVAGTLDRIVRTADGRLMIADLKTGKDVSYAMGEIAVQLALYASATHTFDTATGELWPMAEVDQDTALVFHAPAGTGTCTVFEVDIAAGREMFETIEAVRQWRKRRDLHTPYTLPAPAAPAEAAPDIDRLGWCLAAVTELIGAGHADALAANWPAGIATFGDARASGYTHADAELDTIHRAVLKVAGEVEHPFFKCGPYPDGDAIVVPSDPRVAAVKERLAALPVDLVDIVGGKAAHAGVPKLTSGHARRSHLDQVEGWLEDAEADAAERRSLAAAHIGTLPDDVQPAAMRLAGISEPVQLTALACERLGIVVDCHELGVLRYVANADDLLAADDAFDRLLATHGGSKKALLDAAKEAATLYGLKRPASSSQVANSPMLFAATFMATPNQ